MLYRLSDALNRNGEMFGTHVNTTIQRFLDLDGSLAHVRPPTLRFGLGFRPCPQSGLALVANLEHAGFMPPILHGVIEKDGGRSLRQAQDRSRPQVGTAFPPRRNFIVTPRFATYKVGDGRRQFFAGCIREETSSLH